MKPAIRIDGTIVEASDADVVEVEPGVYSILANGASFEARVGANEVTIAGQTLTFEIDDPRRWKGAKQAAGSHGRMSLTAAMPGKIVRMLVAVGDEVVAGQGIMVVEAMKMQNELKTPRDGRVTAIEVSENESVNAGAMLAVIE
ncbi:MAG TPA: biotin/lipoyl-containing protein [Bryobacteraceae bacterium]|nr:biotin/lipoyl-containing protein [Bryobacteraceae bacterium]